MPSASPSSQCGLGLKSNCGSTPSVRTSTFSLSSAPTGASGCGTLGMVSINSSNSPRNEAARPSSSLISWRLWRPLRAPSPDSTPPRPAPKRRRWTSRERRLCSALLCSHSATLPRHWPSSSSTRSIIPGSAPTFCMPSLTSSGFSRMRLMSSMGLVLRKGRGTLPAFGGRYRTDSGPSVSRETALMAGDAGMSLLRRCVV